MNCREFERTLDREFSDGVQDGEKSRSRLERHAAECAACFELLELARLPQVSPANLAADVLTRTGGGSCRQAEDGLNEFVCGLLPDGTDRDLLAEHLAHCSACSQLAGEIERLAADLPALAIVRLETSLVEEVLRRTLPTSVRVRRWWARTWPKWVRRPRFAIEFAYAATLVLVVAFATPVSPLQAMPERALELARSEPRALVPLPAATAWSGFASKFESAAETARRRMLALEAGARRGIGTITQEVASWFETADDDVSNQDQMKQETP